MSVFWLVHEADPEGWGEAPAFLHPAERPALVKMRAPKRQAEWLHGRWAAKTLLQACHPDCQGRSLAEILLANEPGGGPYAFLEGPARLPGCLSLSHSGPLAAAALTLENDLRVGIDIEKIEARPLGFFESYFTPGEAEAIRASLPADQASAITLVWSAKEASLKALGKGLALDTRRIEIRRAANRPEAVGAEMDPAAPNWHRFEVGGEAASGLDWTGWWRPYRGDYLLTLALSRPGSGQRLAGEVLLQVG